MQILKFIAQHAIWFYAAVNHCHNGHLKAETNNRSKSTNYKSGTWPFKLWKSTLVSWEARGMIDGSVTCILNDASSTTQFACYWKEQNKTCVLCLVGSNCDTILLLAYISNKFEDLFSSKFDQFESYPSPANNTQ